MNNLPLLLNQWEFLLSEHIIRERGICEYNKIINNYGGIRNYLHHKGCEKDLYMGDYSPNHLSLMKPRINPDFIVNNRMVDANGIEAKVVGRLTSNNNLVGPFNYFINNFEKPFETKGFGLSIERKDGYYFTYGVVDNLKAVLMYYGYDALNHLDIYDDDNKKIVLDEVLADEFVKKKDNDFIFDSKINEGKFKGHAGTFSVGSCSHKIALEYPVSLKQILLFLDNKILFPDNSDYQSGSKGKIDRINARPEFYKNLELIKHEILALFAIKYGEECGAHFGHNIQVYYPNEDTPAGHLHHLNVNEKDVTAVTLYEPIETIFLPNSMIENKIFSIVNGEAFKMHFIKGYPSNVVDYYIHNKYGEIILTPKLCVDSVENQASMPERYAHTCYWNGSVIIKKEDLLRRGSSMPFEKPVYASEPEIILSDVKLPMSLANIITLKKETGNNETPSRITYSISRSNKLIKCEDLNCSYYGGYYNKNHKHKPLLIKNVKKSAHL